MADGVKEREKDAEGAMDYEADLGDEEFLESLRSQPLSRDSDRSMLMAENFDADTFVASRARLATLTDLAVGLRTWSAQLESELVDSIHKDYAEYLKLGRHLHTGGSQVESLQRGLQEVSHEIMMLERRFMGSTETISRLKAERDEIWRKQRLAQDLLALDRTVQTLEKMLGCNGSTLPRKTPLEICVNEYLILKDTRQGCISTSHPLIHRLLPRIERLQESISERLGLEAQQARNSGDKALLVKILTLYGKCGLESEGLRVAKQVNEGIE